MPQVPGVSGAKMITMSARASASGTASGSTVSPDEAIGYLRQHEITLTWNPAAAALQARATQTAKTVTVTAR
jgi:hypothetical protein